MYMYMYTYIKYFCTCLPKFMTRAHACKFANNLYQDLPFLPPKSSKFNI